MMNPARRITVLGVALFLALGTAAPARASTTIMPVVKQHIYCGGYGMTIEGWFERDDSTGRRRPYRGGVVMDYSWNIAGFQVVGIVGSYAYPARSLTFNPDQHSVSEYVPSAPWATRSAVSINDPLTLTDGTRCNSNTVIGSN